MCGIIGVTGREEASSVIIKGLKRLEYRGYDSAGVALVASGGLSVQKVVGAVERLTELPRLPGEVGIGHTRWATHGRPSERNAHPHVDCTGQFAIVHNGIVENFAELKRELLEAGHEFKSDTDTEVVAHLVESCYEGDLAAAVRSALAKIEGSYAIAALSNKEPDVIVAARNKSPLLVGLGEGANYLASDATALVDHTRRVVYLLDGEIARLTPTSLSITDLAGKPIDVVENEINWSIEDAEKGGFETFMLKEIHEVPRALHEAIRGRLATLGRSLDVEGALTEEDLDRANRVLVLACGSSYHAGLIGKSVIERLTGIPVDVHLASEYRYGQAFPSATTLAVCVTQSGETADTLEAQRKAKLNEHKTLAITNVVGSTITREADGVLYIRAGPEIGVAATKTFVNTLASFYLLALHLALRRRTLAPAEARRLVGEIKALPRLAQQAIDKSDEIRALAEKHLARHSSAFFLGRQSNHGLAAEGALKLKEISYIHAEAYAAGELKHGPLALLVPDLPVVACVTRDATLPVMLSNITEVRARDAFVLALVEEETHEADTVASAVLRIPSSDPLLFTVPACVALYLLAYHAAAARGCPIDKPRNLAKSVTVE